MKKLGILCHVTSLISKFGVGDFGESSFRFVDFLHENNLSLWQILPLNNVNSFNCPYGSLSTETIDEMFVDLEDLVLNGLLSKSDLTNLIKNNNPTKVDYKFVRAEKLKLFTKAFNSLKKQELAKLQAYALKNPVVFNYAYYKTWLEVTRVYSWRDINKAFWNPNNLASKNFIEDNKYIFTKYVFFQKTLFDQWAKVKKYANQKGIKIIGDLPIYSDKDSVDVFLNHKNFLLGTNYLPLATGGTPPDGFNESGQDWGTCVWNWDYLKRTNYEYLINRIVNANKKFDYLRLDHFPGLVEYYSNSKVRGVKSGYNKGGGLRFFKELCNSVNTNNLIAEDLFAMTPDCFAVKNLYKLKGMNVLQFAFDTGLSNPHLPQNVSKNTIYYLGTHDNNTFMGFLNGLSFSQLKTVCALLGIGLKPKREILISAINSMINSKSDIIILQAQDLLMQGEKYRMNIPGQAADCWEYKLPVNYKLRMKYTLSRIRR